MAAESLWEEVEQDLRKDRLAKIRSSPTIEFSLDSDLYGRGGLTAASLLYIVRTRMQADESSRPVNIIFHIRNPALRPELAKCLGELKAAAEPNIFQTANIFVNNRARVNLKQTKEHLSGKAERRKLAEDDLASALEQDGWIGKEGRLALERLGAGSQFLSK